VHVIIAQPRAGILVCECSFRSRPRFNWACTSLVALLQQSCKFWEHVLISWLIAHLQMFRLLD